MSVAEVFDDPIKITAPYVRRSHRYPPPQVYAPEHSGVPWSTDNPLDGYFTRKGPGYVDPQQHSSGGRSPLQELWLSKGPPEHCAPWLHDPEAQEKAWRNEAGWRIGINEPKPTAEVIEISGHPRFGKEGKPTKTDQAA